MVDKEESEERRKFKILPLSIGIETVGGIFTPVVLRGTPLPAKRHQIFTTAEDDQKSVEIKIYIGERPIAQKNLEISRLHLTDLPGGPKGQPQITLSIEVAQDISIEGEAIEQQSMRRISIHADQTSINLDEKLIKEILQDAERSRDEDQVALRIKEQHNEAQNLIHQAEGILRDKDKIKIYDCKAIDQAVADLGLALQSNNLDQIRAQSSKLKNVLTSSNPFDFGNFGDIFGDVFETQTKRRPQTSRRSYETPSESSKQKPTQRAAAEGSPSVGPLRHDIGKIFGGCNFTPDPNLCFVLMPFLKAMDPIYTDHIKPLVESEGVSCQRADEIFGTNLITYDIWEKLNRTRFIVADLTGKNPNVFYEVGLSHALGKEVILITQSMDDVPFDLKSLRCLVYEFTPRGMKELEDKLVRTIRQVMSSVP
ncbi:MAG: Hsp70 family protein [Syntrophorhabdaceae bacterium]|nr:Hsp70 family protein [Syntrophorhabdaceae bacterium]MDD5242624.1 Hsp70 family protein [Syntrophorhabdaceae bacterium]